MNKFLTLVILLSTCSFGYTQDSTAVIFPKRNVIFVEALGKSLFYSIGYERIFPVNQKLLFTAGLGFSYMSLGNGSNNIKINILALKDRLQFENDASYFNLPFSGSLLLGRNGNYFEIGFSETLWSIYSTAEAKVYESKVSKGNTNSLGDGLEISGVTIITDSQKHNHLELQTNIKIGYKHLNPNGGITYSISFQPFIGKSIVINDPLSDAMQKDFRELTNENVILYSSPQWQSSSFLPWVAFALGYCL